MGYIYKITNLINGKMYVGQTRRTVDVRWGEHIEHSFQSYANDHNTPLHCAIRKYGSENFSVETIEECDDSLLFDRETYWITELGTLGDGYNLIVGGHDCNKCTNAEILELWDKGLSAKEMAEVLPLCVATICFRLKYCGVTQEEIRDRGNKRGGEKKRKPIYQYGLDGIFIKEFPSLASAQAFIGGRRIKFNSSGKVFGGYQWRKEKYDSIDPVTWKPKPKTRKPKPPTKPHYRKVAQFDLEGNYIQTFNSIREAAKSVNGNAVSLNHVCKGRSKSCAGYMWAYAENGSDPLSAYYPNSVTIPVHQYTMDGEYIKTFNSISSAAKSCGIKSGTGGIRGVCVGRNNHSHGYRWSYEKVDKLPPLKTRSA